MCKLEGKVAIVTGSGQGIGRGIALALAKEGAKIVVATLEEKQAKAVAAEILALGAEAVGIVCNTGKKDDVKKTVAAAAEKYGRIDILINNAQTFVFDHPLVEHTDEEMDTVFKTGFWGAFWFMQCCYPYLKKEGGKVINIGSMAGTIGKANAVAYASNKEAIRTMTKVAAREWAKDKINVNCLNPYAGSPTFVNSRTQEQLEAVYASVPLNRLGDCEEDIGRIAVFLASSDSDYITGHTLWADGGKTIDISR
ncbi:MAG: SDR family NAD(P)-dependent oxidoreductase [Christensenellales bacterium]